MVGKKFKKSLFGGLFFGLAAMLIVTLPALAEETKWQVETGYWDLSANWTSGVPAKGDNVIIDIPGADVTYRNSSNPTLNSLRIGLDPSNSSTEEFTFNHDPNPGQDFLTVKNAEIGSKGTADYFHNGGTLKVLQDLTLGTAADGEGNYSMLGGTLSVGGHETLGLAGKGYLDLTGPNNTPEGPPSLGCTPPVPPPPPAGPTHSVGKNLYLGVKPFFDEDGKIERNGEINLSYSSLTVGGATKVGIKGIGLFDQNNSIVRIKGNYYPDPLVSEGTLSRSPDLPTASKKNLNNSKLECVSNQGPGLIVGLENVGEYNLRGGTLNVNYSEIIGLGSLDSLVKDGKGYFLQTDGTHTINGNLYLGKEANGYGEFFISSTNPQNLDTSVGLLDVHGFASVGYLGEGWFTQYGGTVKIRGIDQEVNLKGKSLSTTLSKGQSLSCSQHQYIGFTVGRGGTGDYYLDDGELLVSRGEIIGMLPESNGTFEQIGGNHFIGGNLTIARDLGSTGRYLLGNPPDDEGKPVPTPDGVKLKVQGSLLNNEGGTFDYYGGEFVANVINKGTFKAYGSGTRSFPNQFFNYGTFEIKGNPLGTAAFAQKFRNYGLYKSTEANSEFTYLYIAPKGYLVAGAGDNYYIKKEFTNTSTQNTIQDVPDKKWVTDGANLIFTGPGRKPFKAGSKDLAGFADNFAWNSVRIEGNGSVQLLDVLYAHDISGLMVNAKNKITNLYGTCSTRIYYDSINLDFPTQDTYYILTNIYGKQVGHFTDAGYKFDCN
jgi:hypothetical protein